MKLETALTAPTAQPRDGLPLTFHPLSQSAPVKSTRFRESWRLAAHHCVCWARALAFLGVMTAGVALSPVATAGAARAAYQVIPLGPMGPRTDSFSVGINAHGDVVGQVGTSSQVPFLYRNGRFIRLTPPSGIGGADATGINNADTISVQAYGSNGDPRAFAVRPSPGGFSWIPLPTGSLRFDFLRVAGVASNGDIDGELTSVPLYSPVRQRSVLWRAKADGRYAAAELLPVSRGFVATIAGGIWRHNGTSYVSGAQGNGGLVQDASVWSPRPTLTHVANGMLFASTVGGDGQHVYAAGAILSSTFGAWVSTVSFGRTGEASLKSLETLPSSADRDGSVAEGVSVDSHGRPTVVGDVFSGAGIGMRAALWVGINTPDLLQSLVGSTPWIISEASGINAGGEIAGAGTLHGTLHALLLRPAAPGTIFRRWRPPEPARDRLFNKQEQ